MRRGAAAPITNFQIAIFGPKNGVIFGQNHFIFRQAMDKIFGQLTSAPPKRNWSRTPSMFLMPAVWIVYQVVTMATYWQLAW